MSVRGQLSDNQLLLSFKSSWYFEFFFTSFDYFVDIDHVLCKNDSREVIKIYFIQCALNTVALQML